MEIVDGDTVWRFDTEFLRSNWTCIWGRGCLGILPEPAEHLGQGCCSIGAELDGEDEAMTIGALAATIDPSRFQHCAEAAAGGVFSDDTRTATRVDWEPGEGDIEVATVRRWTREDWGAEGKTMAWCCTEGTRAYVGAVPAVESLGEELQGIVGPAVYVELRRRLTQ